jgi:hypothetical protein
LKAFLFDFRFRQPNAYLGHMASTPPTYSTRRWSANRAYGRFASDLDGPLTASVAMLRSWLIDGRKQDALAESWQLTDRQVRNHLARAADALAPWLACRLDAPAPTIRALFSHLSSDKRRVALHLLEMAE